MCIVLCNVHYLVPLSHLSSTQSQLPPLKFKNFYQKSCFWYQQVKWLRLNYNWKSVQNRQSVNDDNFCSVGYLWLLSNYCMLIHSYALCVVYSNNVTTHSDYSFHWTTMQWFVRYISNRDTLIFGCIFY